MERFRCADASRGRGEPVLGTASRVDRWLLVEGSGPWGPRALPQSRLDEAVILGVQQRAKAAHARLLLIRRPGRTATVGGRVVYAADSRPGHEVLLRRVVDSAAELDDLRPPFEGTSEGWERAAAFVGVCTHGKHDVCCAVLGRPVAAALHASHPDITYEVSHIGGDRFAANILVLPGGHYLGRVPAERAPAVVEAVLDGHRPAPYYRGRTVWAPAVQAAQAFAARALDETSLAALHPRRVDRIDHHRWRVRLAGPTGTDIVVELRQETGPAVSRLTCHAAREVAVPNWSLVAVTTG